MKFNDRIVNLQKKLQNGTTQLLAIGARCHANFLFKAIIFDT